MILIAVPLTCWLCVLLAIPSYPHPDDEIAQLAYCRLVGRHQLLVTIAVAISVVACTGAVLPHFALAATP